MANILMDSLRNQSSSQDSVIKKSKQRWNQILPSKAQLMRRERKMSLKILDLLVTKTQPNHISNMLRPLLLLKSKAKTSVPSSILVKLPSILLEQRRSQSILPLSLRACAVRAKTLDLVLFANWEKAVVILFNYAKLSLRLSSLTLTASTQPLYWEALTKKSAYSKSWKQKTTKEKRSTLNSSDLTLKIQPTKSQPKSLIRRSLKERRSSRTSWMTTSWNCWMLNKRMASNSRLLSWIIFVVLSNSLIVCSIRRTLFFFQVTR